MTCFPSTTPFGLALGADSPCVDERCAGNLGLTATGPFTLFIATHVSIRTSDTSSSPHRPPSQAYGTLSYQTRTPFNPLHAPPWIYSIIRRCFDGACAPSSVQMDSSGVRESEASVIGLAPLHLPRRTTRSVSYYAFFKGWLLLSQPPDCFRLPTSFAT